MHGRPGTVLGWPVLYCTQTWCTGPACTQVSCQPSTLYLACVVLQGSVLPCSTMVLEVGLTHVGQPLPLHHGATG